jgi:hypothetical protein
MNEAPGGSVFGGTAGSTNSNSTSSGSGSSSGSGTSSSGTTTTGSGSSSTTSVATVSSAAADGSLFASSQQVFTGASIAGLISALLMF